MKTKPERTVEEIKAEFQMFVPEDDGSAMDWLENVLEAERQRCDDVVEVEKEYVNAYAEFVDEMSVDTPFNVAFESLNKKLSTIFDKHELTQPNNK